jgi:hypothetical protein
MGSCLPRKPLKGRRTAELALKLEPHQRVAHNVLGNIHITYDWDWPAAEREFKFAIAPPGCSLAAEPISVADAGTVL